MYEHRGCSWVGHIGCRALKGSLGRNIVGSGALRRGFLGGCCWTPADQDFCIKRGSNVACSALFWRCVAELAKNVCTDGSLTWGNERCQLRRRLGLRSYATFEGAFEHAHASHGKIQRLLARWLRRARRGRGRRARTLEGMRVEVPRSTRNRIRRWTGWLLRNGTCMR